MMRRSIPVGTLLLCLLEVTLPAAILYGGAGVRAAELPPEPETALTVTEEGRLPGDDTPATDVTVTHYCPCKKCCGKDPDHPAYGITASGRKLNPGVSVGVDPSVIPLGSTVIVDYGDGELHYYVADDTGSGVDGRHIDLAVTDHQTALNLGVRKATVYWCEEG